MQLVKEAFFNKYIPVWAVCLILFFVIGGLVLFGDPGIFSRDRYAFTVKGSSGEEVELTYGSLPALSNPDFYKSAKESLISEAEDFIDTNLSEMVLRVYKDGKIVKEVPILTKGRKGSWWETPAGLYKAESKSEKHLSSFSPVYTPWNIPFQGNFFIHGWPYWAETGEDVTSSYSGGCIRLSTEDAKAVYELVDVGTPILVYEEGETKDEYTYVTNVPSVSAESFLAADLGNTYVFLESNAEKGVPMGPITNLLSALVATDYMNIERDEAVSRDDLVPTETPRLRAGGTYSVYDLLFLLLIEGSNEAASALASFLGESYFGSLMGKKATSIGMTTTKIEDVHGGGGNMTTAEDSFHLADYLYNYRKFILNLSRGVIDNASYGESEFNELRALRLFPEQEEYVGGIAGSVGEGKESGLAVFDVDFNGTKRPVVISVFGSENAEKDIETILLYVKESFK